MKILYGLTVVISILVRTFLLPDPFECFGDIAFWINLLAELPIHFIVYNLVGIVYSRGSFPILGAFLYLIVYCVVIGVLRLMGLFSFAWWWVLIILLVFGLLIYGVYCLKEKIFNG